LLDQAATVQEAIQLMRGIQVVEVMARGSRAAIHLALADSSGDSAILEFLDGNLVVHHGRQYQILTNDPPYQQQLDLLQAYKDGTSLTGPAPLGVARPIERFHRTAHLAAQLPAPQNDADAIAAAFSLARGISVPKEASCHTEYVTVMNLNPGKLRYHFEMVDSGRILWFDLAALDFRVVAEMGVLSPRDPEFDGNVGDRFASTTLPPF
jgi:choloylglycine hydrolase